MWPRNKQINFQDHEIYEFGPIKTVTLRVRFKWIGMITYIIKGTPSFPEAHY